MNPKQNEALVKSLIACGQGKPGFWWLTTKGADDEPVLFVDRQERVVRKAGREALRTSKSKTFGMGTVAVEDDELVFVNQGRLPDEEALRALRTKLATDKDLTKVASLLRSSVMRSPEEADAAGADEVVAKKSRFSKLVGKAKRVVGAVRDALKGHPRYAGQVSSLARQVEELDDEVEAGTSSSADTTSAAQPEGVSDDAGEGQGPATAAAPSAATPAKPARPSTLAPPSTPPARPVPPTPPTPPARPTALGADDPASLPTIQAGGRTAIDVAAVEGLVAEATKLAGPAWETRKRVTQRRLKSFREEVTGTPEEAKIETFKAMWAEAKAEQEAGDWVEALDVLGDIAAELEARAAARLKVDVDRLAADVERLTVDFAAGAGAAAAVPLSQLRARLEASTAAFDTAFPAGADTATERALQAELTRLAGVLAERARAMSPVGLDEAERQRLMADRGAAAAAFATWRDGDAERKVPSIDQILATRTAEAEPLASGGFGAAHVIAGDVPLLVKVAKSAAAQTSLEREVEVYEAVGPHPNLAACAGLRTVRMADGAKRDGLVLEYVRGGTLEGFMEKARTAVAEGRLTKEEHVAALQHLTRGIVRGLAHLHDKGLFHHDLKPANITVDLESGEAKIIDLGTADDFLGGHATPEFGHPKQTAGWCVPGEEVDQAAVALSVFEGLTGALPSWRPGRMDPTAAAIAEAFRDVGLDFSTLTEEEQATWRTVLTPAQLQAVDQVLATRDIVAVSRSWWRRAQQGERFFENPTAADGPASPADAVALRLGELEAFFNCLFDPGFFDAQVPVEAPEAEASSPEQVLKLPSIGHALKLPFLADSLVGEAEAAALVKRLLA